MFLKAERVRKLCYADGGDNNSLEGRDASQALLCTFDPNDDALCFCLRNGKFGHLLNHQTVTSRDVEMEIVCS
jgi:hypothetical protein